MDFWLEIGVTAVLSGLKQAVKNPDHAKELKSVMLKIYTKIAQVYGTDEDFKAVSNSLVNDK